MSKQNIEFKDSGISYIDKIPIHWNIAKVKNIVKIPVQTGAGEEAQDKHEKSIRYIRISDFDLNGKIKPEVAAYIHYEKGKNFLIEKGDILCATAGATVGKTLFFEGLDEPSCYAGYLAKIRVNPNKMLNTFLLYQMRCQIMDGFRNFFVKKSTIENISAKTYSNMPIIVPPLNEQKKIAEFLDKKCEIIDKRLSNLERKIKSLKEYKKSLISECVTKGLNPKNMEFKDSGIPWIGQIPKHWEVTKIKYECFLKGRIGWQGLTTAEYIEEGAYLVTGVDFLNGNIDWQNCVRVSEWRFNQAPEIQIKNNDLLITKDGTVGKIALTKDTPKQATLNSGVMLIRPKNKNYYEKFLFYILSSDQFWLWFSYINSGNTTIIHLYQNSFDNFSFTLPPLNEQKKIAEFLDKKCEKIDRLNENYTKQITALKEYKKSLIYECVTGKNIFDCSVKKIS
ncbi:restriction endonuclease subunit S [Campylobacter lanienae]|uniref:restriction endonuclease subunit S n=1 Tax=Campylobacter lanienae TaxID=75658 RepID=UPI000BB42921|nr:restriction endonuclease subunit S [Campylobacter lanienae]